MPTLVMKFFIYALYLLCATYSATSVTMAKPSKVTKIKALLITGGCCHDYDQQRDIIPAAVVMKSKLPVEWTILHQKTKAGDAVLEFYKNPNWAKGYDVVVHNECFANIGDPVYINGIIKPHLDGVPAVLIHCTMHCYRTGPTAEKWYEFCGVHSPGHGPKHPFEVQIIEKEHEVMRGMQNWTTPQGELYFIKKTYPGTTPLAKSKSNKTGEMHTNVWVNDYGPNSTRIFATTIGHHNETMLQDQYMELITRGLIWATGNSVSEYITLPK